MIYYKKPFEFLNLGLLAYVGDDKALTEVGAAEQCVDRPLSGRLWGGTAAIERRLPS